VEARSDDKGQFVIGFLGIGALLLIGPLVLERLESLKVSGSTLELTLSKQIVALGAPNTAEQLEKSGLTGFVESYEFIRSELTEDRFREARIRLQDALVERAASLSRTERLDPSEVRRLFSEGSPLLRVLTLGLMQGDLSLADGPMILSGISNSRTGNEQYQALKLAIVFWPHLKDAERASVLAAVEADPRISQDSDRQELARELRSITPQPAGRQRHSGSKHDGGGQAPS
jgi:hypothetical protein